MARPGSAAAVMATAEDVLLEVLVALQAGDMEAAARAVLRLAVLDPVSAQAIADMVRLRWDADHGQ